MPWMCGKRIKYLTNFFQEFDKRLIFMGNNVCIWEIAYKFEKRKKYV